jgi:GNAT superfamily N-acetyltransferase
LIEHFRFLRLALPTPIKPFDCNNLDLNQFLFDDAKDHLKELLAVTYILEDEDETVAYFSVLNDSIREKDTTKSHYKKILGLMPYALRIRYKSHPAVKVGRFAVNKKYQSQGIGTEIMDYIKGYFLDNNKTGCRFIIVDALNNNRTIKFYKDNGFDFLTTEDKKDENRLMFFDLIKYISE